MSDLLKIQEVNFETALIEHLQALGYETLLGSDIDRQSEDFRDVFIFDRLERAIRRINPGIPAKAVALVIQKISEASGGFDLIERNQAFMQFLQQGVRVSFFDGKEQRNELYKLIDFDHPESNDFLAVNQWTIHEIETKRPDLVLFINGMPLVVFELKSPSREETDTSDAYLQIRNYLQSIPSFFVPNVFCVLSDLADTRVGTITSPETRFVQWKSSDGSYDKTKWADYRVMLDGMCQKDRLVDIIHNFTCFNNGDQTFKILAGYHQFFAVRKAVARAIEATKTNGKIGVFWHTQGSGKSLSMVFFVHLLLQYIKTATIIVITDRNDLDDQLFGQFSRCRQFLMQEPQKANSRADLVNLLRGRETRGIFFTTMQKFTEAGEPFSKRHDIIVMADEAHRSQYEITLRERKDGKISMGLAGLVREALPNASFIGFTGTPISTADKNTQEIFGTYIDVYDMTQAVEDGATLPVYYESRAMVLKLDENALEELDQLFAVAEDEHNEVAVTKTKRSFGSLDAVLGTPETIQSLCSDIVQHYESNRAELLTGKAMIVAYSRSIAIKMYRAILSMRPGWTDKIAVVMTGSNQDPEDWKAIVGTDQTRAQTGKDFKDDKSPLKIVIVVDMWLTGFDLPSLSTMYVFKPMHGHNLMQAIARVNRVYKGKEGGLIVDYIGIGNALRTAMADYTVRDRGNFGNMNVAETAYPQFLNYLSVLKDLLKDHYPLPEKLAQYSSKQTMDAILDSADWIMEPVREKQRDDFAREALCMDKAMSLCKSLVKKEDQYLAAFFRAVRSIVVKRLGQGGSAPKISLEELNRRVSELMRESVHSEGVLNLFANNEIEISLFDEAFLEEVRQFKHKNLAVDMLKRLLEGQVKAYQKKSVVKAELFSEMLQKAINGYLNSQKTSAEVIAELIEMAKEIMKERDEAKAMNLSDEEMAFYDAITQPKAVKDFYENDELVALTRELVGTLRANRTIDWQRKESARAQMRRMIKRLLKRYKYPPEDTPEATEVIMKQCELWTDNTL